MTAAIFLVALAGCGGNGGQRASKPKGGVTEYVGTVKGVDLRAHLATHPGAYYVAVAISKSGRVQAYMCDGTGNFQLFSGTIDRDRLDLRSKSGEATLTGKVAGSSVRGTVALKGQNLPFATTQARGRGGLYTFSISRDGRSFRAESVRGNVLRGRATAGGSQLITTFTPPGGRTVRVTQISKPIRAGHAYNQYRVVLLDTGHGRGSPTIGSQQLQTQTSASQLGTTALKQSTANFKIICAFD
jgi:hypothetical protein